VLVYLNIFLKKVSSFFPFPQQQMKQIFMFHHNSKQSYIYST